MFVGAPADPENYQKHQADKLIVYLPNDGVYSSDQVTIDFIAVDGANRLQVRGLITIPSITCLYQNPPTSKARRLLTEV